MAEYTLEEKWEYQKEQIRIKGICPNCQGNCLKAKLGEMYVKSSGPFTDPKRETALTGNCTVTCEDGSDLCRCCNGEGIVECENGCCDYDCKRCDGEGREDDLCFEWSGSVAEAVDKFIPDPIEFKVEVKSEAKIIQESQS
jgi:hypothetical protein